MLPLLLMTQAQVVTFNIENYPRNSEQPSGALTVIAETQAPVIAVQEINDVEHFAKSAHVALGKHWEFIIPTLHPGRQHNLGFLYDTHRVTVEWALPHSETVLAPGDRPAFEVLFVPKRGEPFIALTVHLRAYPDRFEHRQAQLLKLAPVLRSILKLELPLFVIGDFNTCTQDDLVFLEGYAEWLGLDWATRHVPCTAFWLPGKRAALTPSHECIPSQLDHVLTNAPVAVTPFGPCADSCQAGACSVFSKRISDHCPIRAALTGPSGTGW